MIINKLTKKITTKKESKNLSLFGLVCQIGDLIVNLNEI